MHSQKLNSPVTGKPLSPVTLEEGLQAYQCLDSGGYYIPAVCYMQWLEKQPARLPHLPESGSNPEIDSDAALVCPESGTLMTRYKVGHGFTFAINRSITGGIWLDGGEWEALRQRNFHDEIHLVFTAPWQKHVRDERALATYEQTLKSALGPEVLECLGDLRSVLKDHPHQNLAIAYLMNVLR